MLMSQVQLNDLDIRPYRGEHRQIVADRETQSRVLRRKVLDFPTHSVFETLNPAYYIKKLEMVFRACFPVQIMHFWRGRWMGCYWAVLVIQCGDFYSLLVYKLPRFWWWSLRGELKDFIITNRVEIISWNGEHNHQFPQNTYKNPMPYRRLTPVQDINRKLEGPGDTFFDEPDHFDSRMRHMFGFSHAVDGHLFDMQMECHNEYTLHYSMCMTGKNDNTDPSYWLMPRVHCEDKHQVKGRDSSDKTIYESDSRPCPCEDSDDLYVESCSGTGHKMSGCGSSCPPPNTDPIPCLDGSNT